MRVRKLVRVNGEPRVIIPRNLLLFVLDIPKTENVEPY